MIDNYDKYNTHFKAAQKLARPSTALKQIQTKQCLQPFGSVLITTKKNVHTTVTEGILN